MWAITTRLIGYELANASAVLLVALNLGIMGNIPARPVRTASALEGGMRWGDKKSP